MGFEVHVQWFGRSALSGVSRAAVRSLFPIVEEESKPDYWSIRYDAKNSCEIGVSGLQSDATRIEHLYVDRPCADPRLWNALVSLLKMGDVVIFWPGGPPVVADEAVAAELPPDTIDALGQPRCVHTAEELLQLLRVS